MGKRSNVGSLNSRKKRKSQRIGSLSGVYQSTRVTRAVREHKLQKPTFSTFAKARPEFVKRLNFRKKRNKVFVVLGFIALTAMAITPACQLLGQG